MHAIGITGSFGTGKTTVAKLFAKLGAQVIDADRLAHILIKKGGREYKRIVAVFGKRVLSGSGEIDRKKLAEIAFSRRSAMQKLCKVVHPPVIKEIKKRIAAGKIRRQLLVIDAPLLIEAGLRSAVDKLVVVTASKGNQLKRIKNRTGLSRAEILRRIKAQLPLKRKIHLANFIVDNDASLAFTKKQVKRIWREIGGKK